MAAVAIKEENVVRFSSELLRDYAPRADGYRYRWRM